MEILREQITEKIKNILLNEFNMNRTTVNGKECFEFHGEYYRVSAFYLNQPIYCVEWTENLQEAQNEKFEDSYVYGEDLGTEQIIKMLREELKTDIENVK
ncbi:MAG: hypothetical protein K2K57_02695 [Oscillospiraceae bacterium]|nr:hypothetical protein [Oscillospiraceae bacterium]